MTEKDVTKVGLIFVGMFLAICLVVGIIVSRSNRSPGFWCPRCGYDQCWEYNLPGQGHRSPIKVCDRCGKKVQQ